MSDVDWEFIFPGFALSQMSVSGSSSSGAGKKLRNA
jgi:hypothetical protein